MGKENMCRHTHTHTKNGTKVRFKTIKIQTQVTWMNPGKVMLNEISQSQMDSYSSDSTDMTFLEYPDL